MAGNLLVENDKELFKGDGYHYQNYEQFVAGRDADLDHDGQADYIDNYTLRDPHIIVDKDGQRYLVFEANTGTENYQGEHQLYNLANYGQNRADQVAGLLKFAGNKEKEKIASWANGAIGILRLDNNEKNPSVAEVYTPLVTTAVVTDEVERPSIVPMNNKYYLFTASRINKSSDVEGTKAVREAVYDDVVMLGFVSDSLRGEYTPLNGSSVVLTASVPADWRTSTYSYYAVPVEGYNDCVLITAYMTNRGEVAGKGKMSTWAPSFIVKINADNTTQVLARMTEQGDWIWDDSSRSTKHVGNVENARLADEDYYVDWTAIGTYGLPPHDSYDEPEHGIVPPWIEPALPEFPIPNQDDKPTPPV